MPEPINTHASEPHNVSVIRKSASAFLSCSERLLALISRCESCSGPGMHCRVLALIHHSRLSRKTGVVTTIRRGRAMSTSTQTKVAPKGHGEFQDAIANARDERRWNRVRALPFRAPIAAILVIWPRYRPQLRQADHEFASAAGHDDEAISRLHQG